MKKIITLIIWLKFCTIITNAQVDVGDIIIINTSSFEVSENSIFISPLNNANVLNSNNRGITDVDVYTSTNNANSWTNRGAMTGSFADPAVVIDRGGIYYLSFLDDNNYLAITSSSDGGQHWTSATQIYSSETADKDHLWVDNRLFNSLDGTSNGNEGNLYAAYRPLTDYTKIKFSRNTGSGWSTTPQDISLNQSSDNNIGVNIQTGPNGEVYACWLMHSVAYVTQYIPFAIGFNRSEDGGQSWGNINGDAWKAIDNISGIPLTSPLTPKTMRASSFPSMTVNQQNGRIFIVWQNYGKANSCGTCSTFPTSCNCDFNIYMIYSDNKGDTWSSPIKVNQDTGNQDQWYPWIACDEASGALVCIYYDSRDFAGNDAANTYVSISYDQGNTWTDELISDYSWSADAPAGFGSYAGDYIGVDVYHNKAVPVWSDDRSGTLLAYANPFEVPCPTSLNLIYGNYVLTNEKSGTGFTYDASYSASTTMNVAGSSSTYKIHNGANVLMTAGTSVTLNEGFECAGEFIASIGSCSNFSQRMSNNESSNNPPSSPFSVLPISSLPVSLYPNPSSGKIQSYVPLVTSDERDPNNPEPAIISIYNSTGENIYEAQAKEWVSELDLSTQPAGFYLIKVVKGDKVYSGKIILK